MGIVNTKEIRRRRKAKKLSMAAAARLAGWKAPQQWANIEYDRRSDPAVSTLVAVAKALDCTVDDLIKRKR